MATAILIALTSADNGLPMLLRADYFLVAEQFADHTFVYLTHEGYALKVKETPAEIRTLLLYNL